MKGPVNLVLLGMTGTGKSSTGNTIIGKNLFQSKCSSKPVTRQCQLEVTTINGLDVRVIDTPDMFDEDMEPSVRDKHVKNCTELCETYPCVFVLVLEISRFTDEERHIMRKLKEMFGRKVNEKTIILFTNGNDLFQAKMSLQLFLDECHPDLREIVKLCGSRCVLFENRRLNKEQVEYLMKKVKEVVGNNRKTLWPQKPQPVLNS